jgi:hypothetical protein
MPVYVQHEVLAKVGDVFNADALWQAPGLALFSRKPLLRDLLERSPREHRGRSAVRCFSHVTLMLPQDEVDDDRHLSRGARARDLAQSLAALHQKDFGDLLGSDQVRYDVIGAPSISPGQVEVKFGHAVYLPAPNEKILYHLSTSRDSAIWNPVCPIYPDQRLALVGGSVDTASHVTPDWPFGPDAAILIINDGPDAPLEVQMRPKEAFHCSFDPLAGYFTIRSTRDAGSRLLLKVTRVSNAAAKPSALWKSRNAPSQPEQTAAPLAPPATPPLAAPAAAMAASGLGQAIENDATYAPLAQRRMSLVALALPRLSRYRDTGARSLQLGLDRNLGLAAHVDDDIISFAVDSSDQLYAATKAGRQRIYAPSVFTPVEGRPIKLLPVAGEMAERYCATLCLPQPVSMPVAGDVRFVFGRGTPVLAALRVLDAPRHLKCSDGEPASADRIGLSRTAFSFEAVRDGLKIKRLSATQALFHLDEQLQFVASIGTMQSDEPYLLPSGHHIVAGHYVLRFDA